MKKCPRKCNPRLLPSGKPDSAAAHHSVNPIRHLRYFLVHTHRLQTATDIPGFSKQYIVFHSSAQKFRLMPHISGHLSSGPGKSRQFLSFQSDTSLIWIFAQKHFPQRRLSTCHGSGYSYYLARTRGKANILQHIFPIRVCKLHP